MAFMTKFLSFQYLTEDELSDAFAADMLQTPMVAQ